MSRTRSFLFSRGSVNWLICIVAIRLWILSRNSWRCGTAIITSSMSRSFITCKSFITINSQFLRSKKSKDSSVRSLMGMVLQSELSSKPLGCLRVALSPLRLFLLDFQPSWFFVFPSIPCLACDLCRSLVCLRYNSARYFFQNLDMIISEEITYWIWFLRNHCEKSQAPWTSFKVPRNRSETASSVRWWH